MRRDVWDDPNWGWGNNHDWFAAAQRAGDRILTEADPDLLIVIEGINWTGLPVDGLPHERPTLEPVRELSHTLVDSGKLVYSAHFYGYTGPRHSGATGIGETSDPRYRDLSPAELIEVLDRQAFYVSGEEGQHFTAPVWISEFGVGGREDTDPKNRAWFENFVDHLVRTDADFAYWPIVGWHRDGQGNGWGLLHWDAEGERMGLYDGDDWRADAWTRLIESDSRTGPVPQPAHWSQLSPDHGDFVQSRRMRALPDFDSGARKAVCPDGERLLGISHTGNRGLCGDASGEGLWQADGEPRAVTDERHVESGRDWAPGYTKLQCPQGHAATGYGVRGARMSSVLCAPATPARLGADGRTVRFDKGDDRGERPGGGDFARGRHKGQCAADEYLAGIAHTNRLGSARPAPPTRSSAAASADRPVRLRQPGATGPQRPYCGRPLGAAVRITRTAAARAGGRAPARAAAPRGGRVPSPGPYSRPRLRESREARSGLERPAREARAGAQLIRRARKKSSLSSSRERSRPVSCSIRPTR